MATPAAPVKEEPKSRFAYAGEGKDPVGDVLKDPNKQAISGATGTHFEPLKEEEPVPEPAPAPATTTDTAPPPPTTSTSTAPPPTPAVQEKVYAGKFKTPDDLEKAYTSLESTFTKKSQEAAEAKRALEAARAAVAANPDSVAAQTEESRLKLINDFLTNPDAVVKNIEERVVAEARASQENATRVNSWRETNKDLVPFERFVAAEIATILAANPEMEPFAALEQAGTNLRSIVGAIRDDGKKEALSVQSSVTTPAAVKVNVPPPTEQPAKAPMSDQDAFQAHLAELNANAARVRRPVR